MTSKSNIKQKDSNLPLDKICPICGQYNGCKRSKNCWCHDVVIPEKLLNMVPEEKRGLACICKACIENYS